MVAFSEGLESAELKTTALAIEAPLEEAPRVLPTRLDGTNSASTQRLPLCYAACLNGDSPKDASLQ